MRAKDLMSDGVMSVSADASVLEAAKLFINCHVSAMPVVDEEGRMVGIVSEADLVSPKTDGKTGLLARATEDPNSAVDRVDAAASKVTDFMSRVVISASEDTPLTELAGLMMRHHVKRLPIVRDDAVVGIVSRTDLLRALVALHSHRGIKGTRFSRDDQLRREISAACQGRNWSLAKWLDVVVKGGVAHLWGVAPSDIVRRAYKAAAENVPGVKAVEVHMHVVPPPATRIGL